MNFWASEIVGSIRREAERAVAKKLRAKVGFITSYNPRTYAVRVRLEPESTANEQTGVTHPVVETNWLPILRTYGGNGWGMIAPPNANPDPPYGDQCIVLWPDGGHGVALIGFYNQIEQPFTGPLPGEWWITHEGGAFIKLLNDGSVRITDSTGSIIELRPDGAVEIHASAGGSSFHKSDGTVEVTGVGGGKMTVLAGAPGGPPGTSANPNAVVTQSDLQLIVDEIINLVNQQTSPGSNNNIVAPGAKGSATVRVTD